MYVADVCCVCVCVCVCALPLSRGGRRTGYLTQKALLLSVSIN